MATTLQLLKKGGVDIIATGKMLFIMLNMPLLLLVRLSCFCKFKYGEITPAMAKAIGESEALKYFIPRF